MSNLSAAGRIAFVTVAILSTVRLVFAAEDFPTRLERAEASRQYAECEAIIASWEKQEPDNPDCYIAGANYYARRAGEIISINYTAPGKGRYVLKDPKTGKSVAEMSLSAGTEEMNKAIALLNKANKRFPLRLDVWLGVAQIYEHAERDKEQLEALRRLAKYLKTQPQGLLGRGGRPYPPPIRENLAHQFSNFAGRAFARKTPAGIRQFHALGDLTATTFPDAVYGFNLLGNYYSLIEKNFRLAVENYRKALAITPTDSLVWCNLGETYRQAGQGAESRKALRKVLELNNDPSTVELAKKLLAELPP